MGDEDATGVVAQESGEAAGHHVEIVEQGAFAHARCSCGWRGPARRARERARADASAHLPDTV